MLNKQKHLQIRGGINVSDSPPSLDKPKSIIVTPDDLVLDIGDTQQLHAVALPDEASQVVTWHSSDPAIASVDDSGHVTCHAGGDVVITAQSLFYPNVKGESNIRIRPIPTAINIIDDASVEGYVNMFAGDSYQVKWEVIPEGANPNVTFSLPIEYTNIDDNGLITINATIPTARVNERVQITSVADNTVIAKSPYLIYRRPAPTSLSITNAQSTTVNRSNNELTITSSPNASPAASNITFDNDVAVITSIGSTGAKDNNFKVYFNTLDEVGSFVVRAESIYRPIVSTKTYYVHPEPTAITFSTQEYNIVKNDGVVGIASSPKVQPYYSNNIRPGSAIQTYSHDLTTPSILASETLAGAYSMMYVGKAIGVGKVLFTSKENTSITGEVTINVNPLESFVVIANTSNNASTNTDEYVYKMKYGEVFPKSIYPHKVIANGIEVNNPNYELYTISANQEKITIVSNNAAMIYALEPMENEIIRVTNNDRPEFYGEIKLTVIPYGS